MRPISELRFREVLSLPIPCEVLDGGLRKTVTYRLHIPNRGVGMGEGPDEVLLVLSDGTVFEWGSWAEVDKPRLISYHGREQGEMLF